MREINNNQDVIDSRDVIERIEELQAQLDDTDVPAGRRLTEDEADELSSLLALACEGENNSEDWAYGAQLIRDDFFTDYMKEFTTDVDYDTVGKLPDYIVIDWEATAENLMVDYNEIEFGDVTYYIR